MFSVKKIIELLKDKEKMKHYSLYIFFGVLTTVVDFSVFYVLDKFVPALNKNISNAIAIFVAIVFAYFTNREYVFESKETNKLREFFKFFLSRMFSSLFNIVAFAVLTSITTIDEMIIKVCISFVVIILNYVISQFFVFKKVK